MTRAMCLCPCCFADAAARDRADRSHWRARVLDPQGRPVAGATVVVVGLTSAPRSARTDDERPLRARRPARRPVRPHGIGARAASARRAASAVGERHANESRSRCASAPSPRRWSCRRRRSISRSRARPTASPSSRGDELEARQVTSLGDALSSVPGFTVARNGGPGTLTSLFPRGGESDFTLVLVDGIRANAFGGGLDLSQVPLADVERIEVVRGPQSALYGADAIGGVVQVITRQGGAPSVRAQIRGRQPRPRARARRRHTASSAAGAGRRGGDYFADEGFTGIAPANGERVSNDDARERQGWVGGGWRGRARDRRAGRRSATWTPIAARPAPTAPIRRDDSAASIGSARGDTERQSVGVRIVHPWTGPASRVRQRIEFDVADYDLAFLSAFDPDHPRNPTRGASTAACRPMPCSMRGIGVSGGVEWLTERARSTFITAGAVEGSRRSGA